MNKGFTFIFWGLGARVGVLCISGLFFFGRLNVFWIQFKIQIHCLISCFWYFGGLVVCLVGLDLFEMG